MKKYILSLDQGTTSSRAVVFDKQQTVKAIAALEHKQYYPHSGWVEHDAEEILNNQLAVIDMALKDGGISPDEIAAVGITNQRETTIVWEKATGKPICPAIVWQCRRTSDMVEELKEKGLDSMIRAKTGLPLDAYFSATKLCYILNKYDNNRERARKGELLFGTIDTWLLWKLTGGRVFATDRTNASRTMLYNIHTLKWDSELLELFRIPKQMLPEVKASGGDYGTLELDRHTIPITGVAGDQQTALFGQCCFSAGQAKNTYGTGCFLLVSTGSLPSVSKHGMITTLAATCGDKPSYALEGSVFIGGAVMQWLRDGMELLEKSSDAGMVAETVADNGGVYFVPAFAGLGAPYWDMHAKGAIVGLTGGTTRAHIVRAAEEAIAFQSAELVKALELDSGLILPELVVDGGASRDDFLMQFQADILNKPVRRRAQGEITSLGTAFLAGLTVGFFSGCDELSCPKPGDTVFLPKMDPVQRENLLFGWKEAVERVRSKK